MRNLILAGALLLTLSSCQKDNDNIDEPNNAKLGIFDTHWADSDYPEEVIKLSKNGLVEYVFYEEDYCEGDKYNWLECALATNGVKVTWTNTLIHLVGEEDGLLTELTVEVNHLNQLVETLTIGTYSDIRYFNKANGFPCENVEWYYESCEDRAGKSNKSIFKFN